MLKHPHTHTHTHTHTQPNTHTHITAVCGDGIVVAGETCDDNNTRSGDGCSSSCQLEPGYACVGTVCSGKNVKTECNIYLCQILHKIYCFSDLFNCLFVCLFACFFVFCFFVIFMGNPHFPKDINGCDTSATCGINARCVDIPAPGTGYNCTCLTGTAGNPKTFCLGGFWPSFFVSISQRLSKSSSLMFVCVCVCVCDSTRSPVSYSLFPSPSLSFSLSLSLSLSLSAIE